MKTILLIGGKADGRRAEISEEAFKSGVFQVEIERPRVPAIGPEPTEVKVDVAIYEVVELIRSRREPVVVAVSNRELVGDIHEVMRRLISGYREERGSLTHFRA